MLMFTQTWLRFVPDGPIKNRPSIMQVMVRWPRYASRGPPWRDKKDSATNEKWWHHFRILIADKWSVVWNECKNREFLLTGWKSLWSLATWLVISDRYIGEVILQLSIEAMASHSNSTKPLPQLRTEYILLIASSSTTHYVCFLSGTVYN